MRRETIKLNLEKIFHKLCPHYEAEVAINLNIYFNYTLSI